jgi:hypothetical protein
MRQLIVGVLVGTILITIGCNKKNADNMAAPEAAAKLDTYTVRAGSIPNAKLAALAGTFQLLKISGPDAIPSDGHGGACLVVAATAPACTKNSDCPSNSSGGISGYCDTEKTHTCWATPPGDPGGVKSCNRPILMSPNALNPAPVQPADGASIGIKVGDNVRVVACLNKGAPPYGPDGPPCKLVDSPDRIERMGEPTAVKP